MFPTKKSPYFVKIRKNSPFLPIIRAILKCQVILTICYIFVQLFVEKHGGNVTVCAYANALFSMLPEFSRILNQLKEDQVADQMTLKEYADPFKADK